MVDSEETQDTSEAQEQKRQGSASARTAADSEDTTSSEFSPGDDSDSEKGVEDKLDDFADRFSNAVTEGVKRMESAFEKGVNEIRDNPQFSKSRVRGFFTSSAGGSILVVIGFIWLFYAVGLLDKPVFPALLIILGFYLMHRYKSEE